MTAPQNTFAIEQTRPFSPDLATSFNVRSFFKRVLRNWYWYVLAMLVLVGLAYVYVRYTVPVYSATSKMLIKSEESGSDVTQQALDNALGFQSVYNIVNEIQVLKSTPLMRRVVDSLRLNYRYTHQGQVRATDLYRPETFRMRLADSITYDDLDPVRYGSVELRLRTTGEADLIRGGDTSLITPTTLIEVGNRYFRFERDEDYRAPVAQDDIIFFTWSDPMNTARGYAGGIGVAPIEKSNVVTLGRQDVRPERAVDVLNALMYFYDASIVEDNAKTGSQTLDFIQNRLASVRDELFAVETRLEAYKRGQNISVGVLGNASDYLTRLNDADSRSAELQVRREIIEEIIRIVSNPATEFEPIPISSEVIDGGLAGLITNYNDLIFQRQQTLETATALNPGVATYGERITSLRNTLKSSLQSLRRETIEREGRIQARIAPLERSLTAVPERERVLIQLAREERIKEELYVFLSQRKEETAISVASKVGNTRVIEAANSSYVASWPKPSATYAFAGLMALLLPTMVLGLIEMLSSKLRTADELKQLTSVPVLGSIVLAEKSKGLAFGPKSRSATAEMFRLLRTNLYFLFRREGPSVVLVTSGSSGEGKSYVTANLGAAAALSGQRVLIVEADLRRPSLVREVTGVKKPARTTGLAEMIRGEAVLAEAVQATEIENLSMLSAGVSESDSADLLFSNNRFGNVLKEMREHYDLILVDTAPVGLVSDAFLMRDHADATIYVVREGLTPKRAVTMLEEFAQEDKLANPAIVLNGVSLGNKKGYGSGYGYYHKGK